METDGLPNGRLHAPHDSAYAEDESARVKQLEEEVSMLTEKVMESAGRFANYENEIRRLNALLRKPKALDIIAGDSNDPVQPPAPVERPGISRFGSFMHSRKTQNAPQKGLPTAREQELEAALAKEQVLRHAAEHKVSEVHGEIEDLSATLFQQANEMVATERKESAKLRDRLKVLEQRDADRKRRLDKLEAANRRIERARALLLPR